MIIILDDKYEKEWKTINKKFSHSSKCIYIIKKYFINNKLKSINILNYNGVCSSKELIEALMSIKTIASRIIHMSIGSIQQQDFESINTAIHKLNAVEKIVVAACHNKNVFTVPACLSNVVSVARDDDLKNDEILFNLYNCDGIDFLANGRHELFDGYITPQSNSFAAPVVTAHVSKLLEENPNLDVYEIKKELTKISKNYVKGMEIPLSREEILKSGKIELLDKYYNTRREIQSIDVPIIALYDFGNDGLKKMKKLFNNDGYNCLAIANIPESDFFDVEYINFGNNKIISKGLKALFTVYNPDIIVLNIENVNNCDIREYSEIDVMYNYNDYDGYNKDDDILYIKKNTDIKEVYNRIIKEYEDEK